MHYQQNEKNTKRKKDNLQRIKHKIVVMSGKGGVGKSTVSVNLAYALAARGHVTGIMDIDFHGPSIAKMTAIEGYKIPMVDGETPAPIEAAENVYVLSLASLLQNEDDAVIWRGPMKMGVIEQFLGDFQWPELDYLIVDCPPGTGDEPLSIIQSLEKVSGVVIVSTPQDLAFADAKRSISFCEKLETPILGIVENMSGFVCPHCGQVSNIFKTNGVENKLEGKAIHVLGHVPLETAIVDSGDDGKPYINSHPDTPGGKVFAEIAETIREKLKSIG